MTNTGPLMGSIEPLIQYLKIYRRAEEDSAKETTTEVDVIDENYDIDYPFDNTKLTVLKSELTDLAFFRPLKDRMTFNSNDFLAIEVFDTFGQPNSMKYYHRRVFNATSNEPLIRYRDFINSDWIELDDSAFILIPLDQEEKKYLYNSEINRVVYNNSLNTAFAYNDVFNYDPKDTGVESKKYRLNYVDHNGNRFTYLNPNTQYTDYAINQKLLNLRNANVIISQTRGKVYLFPTIRDFGGKYILEYKYVLDEFSRFDIKDQKAAIEIQFYYIGSMLYFLNRTVFYNENFDTIESKEYLSTIEQGQRNMRTLIAPEVKLPFNNGGIRQFFIDQYISYVKKDLNFYKTNLEASLQILHYTPKVFIEYLSTESLWRVIAESLKGNVTNVLLDKEDITLKLLIALEEKMNDPTLFLEELLTKKDSENISYFFNLFSKMNTSNFDKYNEFIKEVWNKSQYKLPTKSEYLATKKVDQEEVPIYDGPLTLPYQSDKTIGFYHSNVNIEWTDNYSNLEVKLETGKYEEVRTFSPTVGGSFARNEAITADYTYHPFQPIFILQPDKQKTELKLDNIIPAFYLKAVETKKAVANIYTTIEYGLDIVVTFSGVGNISKFRHLAKVAKVASRLSKAQKAARYAKVVSKIKLIVGSVEITSGTVNTLIKLTGLKDTELGQEISTLLFWIEMASLSGEAIGAIKTGLRNSAKKALQKKAVLKKNAKNTAEAKEIDEVVEFLEETARIIENVTPKKVYKPLILSDAFGFVAAYENLLRRPIFYLKNLLKPNTETLFIRGVEVFTGTKSQMQKILNQADDIFKKGDINTVDNYFEALGSKLPKRRLHSQTGELFIGTLVRKKTQNKYYYELENFQYHTKQKWNKYDKVKVDRFDSYVSLANKPITEGRNILHADLYIPKALNDVLQANKVNGLTDISLGKAILDDGLAVLRKDVGGELDGIYGEWIRSTSYLDYGGESVNLTKLKEAMIGKEITEANLKIAAIETFTGKWAKSKGFEKVEIITTNKELDRIKNIKDLKRLEVIFTK